MPQGGQSGGGSSGLRLQTATPGTADTGNAHVSGTIIADTAMLALDGQPQGNNVIFYGSGISVTTNGESFTNGTFIGNNQTIGPSTTNVSFTRPVDGMTVIGVGAISKDPNCTVIGQGASSTHTQSAAGVTDGSVVIGRLANVLNNGDNSGNYFGSVCIGGGSNAGHHAIVIGPNVTTGNLGYCLIIGGGLSGGVAPTNAIYIDVPNASIGGFPSMANGIRIGNSSHTGPVTIGPYSISPGSVGAVAQVADVNYTFTAGVGVAQYSTLTAARTVTLPAANSLPAGGRVMVVDFAGTATANNITIQWAGADTIQGGTSTSIALNWGDKELMSDGVSKWNIIRTF